MYDWVVLWDWVQIAARWVHVVTAMAWIGSSFYFIALDLGLRRDVPLPPGASGEEWQVHGGGFYHIQKYMVAPAALPDHLIWFKWESYSTWLSGFVMLVLVYYMGAQIYLIDPAVMDLSVGQAVAISLASLAFGWVAYTTICRVFMNANQTAVMVALFVVLVGMSWFYAHVFSGRAALLHLGAFTASIMSGNVFFVIMPNQRVVVADLKAGRTPDAKYGKIAKQRSTHNNYLTLPVIFLMLSNHYPLVFATPYNWIIASLVFLMGVTIRHYFNTLHATGKSVHWTWLATALMFIIIMWLSTAPMMQDTYEESQARDLSPVEQVFANADGFETASSIIPGRCAMCHAREPNYEGIYHAPKGILLETPADVAKNAQLIYIQSGMSVAMPPANVSMMEDQERMEIRRWYDNAMSDAPMMIASH